MHERKNIVDKKKKKKKEFLLIVAGKRFKFNLKLSINDQGSIGRVSHEESNESSIRDAKSVNE